MTVNPRDVNRRAFVRSAAWLSAAWGARGLVGAAGETSPAAADLPVHLFSKHLQFLDYEVLAEQTVAMGFAGIDLTVRPGGHVEPEHAMRDLPRAAAAMRRAGLVPTMATTAFTAADEPHCDATFGALADTGFSDVRLGWHKFVDGVPLPETLERLQPVAAGLAASLQRHGLRGSFQNHSGTGYVGSSVWELWRVLEGIDPTVIGLQFDIRHAMVERGLSWQNELALAGPKIASVALKDFRWTEAEQTRGGRVEDVPVGEGWVDFRGYFQALRGARVWPVPATLHVEHPLGGVEHGSREPTIPLEQIYHAIRQDLGAVREAWRSAS